MTRTILLLETIMNTQFNDLSRARWDEINKECERCHKELIDEIQDWQ